MLCGQRPAVYASEQMWEWGHSEIRPFHLLLYSPCTDYASAYGAIHEGGQLRRIRSRPSFQTPKPARIDVSFRADGVASEDYPPITVGWPHGAHTIDTTHYFLYLRAARLTRRCPGACIGSGKLHGRVLCGTVWVPWAAHPGPGIMPPQIQYEMWQPMARMVRFQIVLGGQIHFDERLRGRVLKIVTRLDCLGNQSHPNDMGSAERLAQTRPSWVHGSDDAEASNPKWLMFTRKPPVHRQETIPRDLAAPQ